MREAHKRRQRMLNVALLVNGAEARRSRLIDRRSLLSSLSLISDNPQTESAEISVRCRSGPGKAKPPLGRISALAGRKGRLRACYIKLPARITHSD